MATAPASASKTFTSAYLLDGGKLLRIQEVLEDEFKAGDFQLEVEFAITHRDNTHSHLGSLDEVLRLDNTVLNPITELTIRARDPREDLRTQCVIRYDSDDRSNVSVFVASTNRKWVDVLFSEVNKQVRRTLQTSTVYRVFKTASFKLMSIVATLILSTSLATWAGSRASSDGSHLSGTQVASLLREADSARGSDLRKTQFLFDYLVSELRGQAANQPPSIASLFRLKPLAIALPILVVVGCAVIAIVWFYPWAVFAWGDCEQIHDRAVTTRRFLWGTVILSLVIGIVGNLFVWGLIGSLGG